jgi:glucans biosynthesis protein C
MRRHGMDWLRIFGIFLLFPFHTARIFNIWEKNYVMDTPNVFSSWFIVITFFWFMPLLFFISGFASYYGLIKRGWMTYIKERFLRLLVPFVLGVVLIVPVQGYYASLQHEGLTGGYFKYLGSFFTDFSDLTGYTGGFTPSHLWFILYLFVISIVMLPFMQLINKTDDSKFKFLTKPWLLVFAFVPLTAMLMLPGIAGKNPFYFAIYFLLGFLSARVPDMLEAVQRHRLRWLISMLGAVSLFLMVAFHYDWPEGYSAKAILIAVLRAIAAWFVLLTLIGYANKYLKMPSNTLKYLNQAAYPVYLLHQSLMMIIAYYIVLTNLSPMLKFLTIMMASLVASLAGFEMLKRFKITRFILGIK